MEDFNEPISRGDRRAIHILPSKSYTLPVMGGIDYNLDTLHLKYDKKYSGFMLTITYSDANGLETQFGKILEPSGVMSWLNDKLVSNPNFGYIGFSCRQELFFEFSFD